MSRLNRRVYMWLRDRLVSDHEAFSPHGIPVRVPKTADPSIRYLLARGRPYEQPESELVRELIPKGTNVIELGGCLGIVSATIRQQIGAKARHIIVEARTELIPVCEANASREAEAGTTMVIQAAIDYSGSPFVEFALGHNIHVGHVAGPNQIGVRVPATTLSKVSEQIPSQSFALVCDIEGAELALVQHETQTLQRVSVLILETHPDIYANGTQDLDHLIANLDRIGLHRVAQKGQVYGFQRRATQ
jgi:FkbM family methyltransferase